MWLEQIETRWVRTEVQTGPMPRMGWQRGLVNGYEASEIKERTVAGKVAYHGASASAVLSSHWIPESRPMNLPVIRLTLRGWYV